MSITNIQLVLFVVVLFSLSEGIFSSMLSRHISFNGANHIVQGCLHVSIFVAQSISQDFINFYTNNVKQAINFSLVSSFLCFFTVVYSADVYTSFLCRVCFALVNRVPKLAKQFVTERLPEESHVECFNKIDAFYIGSFTSGKIISGYVYESDPGFSSNAVFASILTFTAIYHLTKKGATELTDGFLVAMIVIFQSLSRDFVAHFGLGKRKSLLFCLYCAFLTFFCLVFFSNLWVTLACRIFFALFSQVFLCAKEYVERTEPEHKHVKYFNEIEISKIGGHIVGNILGGYIYVCNEDFSSNAMHATIIVLITILLMQYIDEDPDGQKPETNFLEIPSNCIRRLENLKTIKYKKHWDSILLQASYTTTFSIYFIRYCFIITYNYKIGTVLIGYSIAYQHLWLFATSFLIPFIKRRTKNKKLLFEHSLLISGFILSGLYYAPSYECFLVIQIPMLFCFVLTNSLLEEDALGLKQEGVHEISGTISYLVNVFGPITFGIICEYVGGSGFKALSLLPIVICIYILNQRFLKTRHIEIVEGEEEQPESSRVKED